MARLLATGERLYPSELADRYRAAGLWSERTTGQEIRSIADRFPDRIAVVSLSDSLTYTELDARTDRLAVALRDLGLELQDPVVFQMGNELEAVVGWYGALKAGLVPIASLPNHGAYEIGHIIEFTGARAHLAQADYRTYDLPALGRALRADHPSLEVLVVARGEAGDIAHSFDELIASVDREEARARVDEMQREIDPEGIALFQLSGGTTGVPKVIPHSHASYVGGTHVWADHWEWDESIVTLHTWPILHNAGLFTALQSALAVGGTCVISSSNDPEVVLGLIERHRVNVMTVSPPLIAAVTSVDDASRFDTSSVTHLYGPNDEALMASAEAALGGEARGQFGMGEGAFLACALGAGVDARHGTSGASLQPETEVRVLDPDSERELPAGEVGELVFRGPFVVRAYFRAPEVNERSFTSDGFLRTGDYASAVDIDGVMHYRVVGRLKDNVVRGGEKFMASELEGLLMEHPAIAQAAVIGMPDEVLGERVCAYVVPSGEGAVPDVAEVASWLQELGVAKYKYPERIETIDALPVTAVGKVNKPRLRDDIVARTTTTGGSP
jgi:non-ribosomal peptide synthetase component E (peptide arylation enzyme)